MRFTTTWVSAVAVALLAACSPGAGSSPVPGMTEGAPAAPALQPPPVALAPWLGAGAPALGTHAPPADPSGLDAAAPATSSDPHAKSGGLADLAPILDERPRPQRQWDHVFAAGAEACREQLAATGAKFQPLPDRPKPDAKGCGSPHGVLLSRGPTGIRYSPPVSLDCSLALRLVEVERVVQEEAETHLESRIQRVGTLGSYACRGVIGRLAGWSDGISEHSFGNAIDIMRFDPVKGRPATILRGYEAGVDEPTTKEGRFLLAVARRLRREAGVRVLGPDFDASHRDHFHLDAGLPRWR